MDVQRIAIVDPSDATREPLRNLLLGIESVWLEAECSRYEFFIDVARQSTPDLVVIALDADHGKALQLIQQLTMEFVGLPILAVSSRVVSELNALLPVRAGQRASTINSVAAIISFHAEGFGDFTMTTKITH